MKLVNFRRLKSAVGHEHVNDNSLKIKFTLNKIWTGWKQLLGDRRRSDKLDPGDRETVPDQVGAVVPDCETAREEIRPETHWLVRTECKK